MGLVELLFAGASWILQISYGSRWVWSEFLWEQTGLVKFAAAVNGIGEHFMQELAGLDSILHGAGNIGQI